MGIDGSGHGRCWLNVNASPIREEGHGGISGVVATFVDITDQRVLESQLARSLAELGDPYENPPCGYHALDADGKFLRVNATELSWLGCTREEVIGRLGPPDFFTEEGRETFRRNFPHVRDGENLEGVELELVGREGRRRRVSATATAVRADDGRFLATRSVLHDITELHRTRAALERINAEQAAMLDNDLIGILRVRQRHIVCLNQGMARIFGYPRDELLGQSTRMLYPSDSDFGTVGAEMASATGPNRAFRSQVTMQHKDGRPLWIDLSRVLLPVATGESLGLLVDITPLKEAEETRIKAIALDAENTQLRETNRLKDLVLSNLSHELRTPLNAVVGLSQLMMSGAVAIDSPKYARFATQINSSGWDLLRLIDSMLDFARIESGKIELRPEPVKLSLAVRDVVGMLREGIERRRIEIVIALDPDVDDVTIDPTRLRQVVAGYLGNAVKFSPEGGRIVIRSAPDDGDRFRIEVEDHGPGIAEADLPGLFVYFHRIGAGNTNTHAGTGLGLALVRRVVEAQGRNGRRAKRVGQGQRIQLFAAASIFADRGVNRSRVHFSPSLRG